MGTRASEETQNARAVGLAMPAEWAAHELTLMAWPARLELWGDGLAAAKSEYVDGRPRDRCVRAGADGGVAGRFTGGA